MPATVQVLAVLEPDRRAELETVLAVLGVRGFAVRILPDGDAQEPPTGLGWRVIVDAPGYHAATRLRPDGTPAEWKACLATLVGRS